MNDAAKLQSILATIRERADRATEGPWIVGLDDNHKEYTGLFIQTADAGPYTICEYLGYTPGENHDPAFIAAARTDVPKLVSALARAMAALQAYELVCSDPLATETLTEITRILTDERPS